ncbi:MAG: Arginine/ornithine antiporter ArcD [uncultured Sulfurovum sp.]|uniref:Arginine/ornithine antiporter ArcD n=1 Tax=uncultured Sulfurovum sp. TaxID=269237 RepID=A0A6S6TMG4_9BACT|nr:MAG: Arginine/ornithine antiporter ArcD [uncultured Sulfurovum sp.]
MNNSDFQAKDLFLFIPLIIVGGLLYWLTSNIDGLDDILDFIKEWQIVGYMILAFFSFGGSLIWTIAAGMAAALGVMNLYVALTVGIIFNYMGDMFLFYLGKYQKEEIKPYFEKHKRKLALATLIMRKYGVLAIFIQKYLYGIKTIIPISMSLSRYDFKKFGFYNIFASIIFVSSIMLTSYYSTDKIREFLTFIDAYPWWVPVFILLAILATIWYGMEHLTRKKS